MTRRGPNRRLVDALCYGVLTVLSGFSVGPVLWVVASSFSAEAFTVRGIEFPRFTISNYVKIWEQSHLVRTMLNSGAVTIVCVLVCLTVGTVCAYALSRSDRPAMRYAGLALLFSRMLPPALLVAPLYALLRAMGLVDSIFGLAISYVGLVLPNFVWLTATFFDTVPRDFDDAARVDGATRFGALVRVVAPVAASGLGAASAFVAILAWNEFVMALMLTTGSRSRTWPVGLQLMVGEFQLPWGMMAAAGTLSIIPPLLLYALFGRLLLRKAPGPLRSFRHHDRA